MATNKCINNFEKDLKYKYQYNSECLEKCQNNTIENEFKICEDKNLEICSLSTYHLN